MSTVRRIHRPQSRQRSVHAFVLGLALVASGVSGPRSAGGTVSAQAPNPCALLMADEIPPPDEKVSVAAGVSSSIEAYGRSSCRYAWGAGTDRVKLEVVVTEASRAYPGLSPDQIKQMLLTSVRAGTADAVVPDIGEAAVFRPESSVYAGATALVKGRILAVYLDGVDAREKKDQVVRLLKSAASRL